MILRRPRHTHRQRRAILLTVAAVLSLSACTPPSDQSSPPQVSHSQPAPSSQPTPDSSQPAASQQIDSEQLASLSPLLRDTGLGNVEHFEQWVRDTQELIASDSQSSGFSDADCRMTVMLLAGDDLAHTSTEATYDGTYLMFDLDAIDSSAQFRVLKDKRALFTTMFGEMPIPASGLAQALPDRWHKHGISLTSEKYSIISVVFETLDLDQAFVGHTGLLIDVKDRPEFPANYVFLEKIAFASPFTLTILNDEKELVTLLASRPDYTVEEGQHSPVVLINDRVLGELGG